ncbi:hypothetical protein [Azospirillum picis]|uniref:Uncharacterized protein n=1 Tax=Azospirillum picis TaxID=488438 RepID=A0ABU0MS64_9PROT|nr:hypothetical protein [Azospirillum picis]MBP2302475.1 hypothetical protein [Azospirillum picis]MDQ0536054.1 hypothetical protein [Azospirillum picis]
MFRPAGADQALGATRTPNGPAGRSIGEQRRATVGRQGGGRVFLFLEADDFARDHARHLAVGVVFREPPRSEPYGMVAKFERLYGNRWDLIEPRTSERSKTSTKADRPLSTPAGVVQGCGNGGGLRIGVEAMAL